MRAMRAGQLAHTCREPRAFFGNAPRNLNRPEASDASCCDGRRSCGIYNGIKCLVSMMPAP